MHEASGASSTPACSRGTSDSGHEKNKTKLTRLSTSLKKGWETDVDLAKRERPGTSSAVKRLRLKKFCGGVRGEKGGR